MRLGREWTESCCQSGHRHPAGDLRAYFENNRSFFVQHVTTARHQRQTPAERHNHFIRLDKYGRFPFDALPRLQNRVNNWKSKIDSNGCFPGRWRLQPSSPKHETRRWDEARLTRRFSHFMSRKSRSVQTTENSMAICQSNGINERFGTTLIDRSLRSSPSPNDGSSSRSYRPRLRGLPSRPQLAGGQSQVRIAIAPGIKSYYIKS